MVARSARTPRRRRWFPGHRAAAVGAWALALLAHALLIAGLVGAGGAPVAEVAGAGMDAWRSAILRMSGRTGRDATQGARAAQEEPAQGGESAAVPFSERSSVMGAPPASVPPREDSPPPSPPRDTSRSAPAATPLEARQPAGGPESVRRAPASQRAQAAPRAVPLRASFDCTKARSPSERAICADAELARLDRDLGRLYAQARQRAPDAAAFKRQGDREWQRRESTCRGDRDCLRRWYAQRREQLQAMLRASARKGA